MTAGGGSGGVERSGRFHHFFGIEMLRLIL